jgi:hypothetical protein
MSIRKLETRPLQAVVVLLVSISYGGSDHGMVRPFRGGTCGGGNNTLKRIGLGGR